MSNVTPSVISSSPPTAGNGGSCKDVHDFWLLESRGVDAPVSSMLDSGTLSNNQSDSNISINYCNTLSFVLNLFLSSDDQEWCASLFGSRRFLVVGKYRN